MKEEVLQVLVVVKGDGKLPRYANPGDAGCDLYTAEDVTIYPGESVIVPTNLFIQLEPGYEVQIRPRSGIATKTNIRVVNSPATIDSGYRGNVGIALKNDEVDFNKYLPKELRMIYTTVDISELDDHLVDGYVQKNTPVVYHIPKGTRICQMVLAKYVKAEFKQVVSLDDSVRGDGGFGSSGELD